MFGYSSSVWLVLDQVAMVKLNNPVEVWFIKKKKALLKYGGVTVPTHGQQCNGVCHSPSL